MANMTAGVGPRAQQVLGVYADTVSIQNIGPGDIFLGSDGSVSPSNGWKLPENGMGTWKGGSELWVCNDGTAASTEVRIADSNLAFFTPGPDHVTIDGGTVTIDNASIPISGSVDITGGDITADISGPVTIAGGNVQVGGTVTSQNAASVLFNNQTTTWTTTAAGTTIYDSNGTDLSPYSSVVLAFGNANVTAVDPNSGTTLGIEYLTTNGILIREERPRFLASGVIRYTSGVVAPRIRVKLYQTGPSPAQVKGGLVAVTSAALPHSYYQTPGNSNQTTFPTYNYDDAPLSRFSALSATLSAAGGSSGTWYPSSWAGQASFFWQQGTVSTAASTFLLSEAIWNDRLQNSILTNSNRIVAGSLILPEAPIVVSVTNNESGTNTGRSINAALTYS